jgi:LacI family transcriptional regulator
MSAHRRVLLITDASYGYDRRVLSGVGHYSRFVRNWSFRSFAPWELDLVRKLLVTWQPTGVISCVRTSGDGFFELIAEHHLPMVQADGVDKGIDAPCVYTDGVEVARMVADYLANRGIRSFGYVGGTGLKDTRQAAALEARVTGTDFSFARFSGEIRSESDPSKEFHRWLRSRPRPAGLLTATDWVGWHVISEALEAGFHVPDDFAVIGIGDDRPWCELAPVPLSSVAIAAEKIGYQAASMLDRMMSGNMVSTEPVILPPVGIVARRSTDTIAADDPDIAEVLRYMHDHAIEGCSVKELLQRVPMDRRRLERWFRQNLGRSPLAEIQRLRIGHVKRLLAETQEGMEEIAARCGYVNAKLLSRSFRREAGTTLLQYRRQFRGGRAEPADPAATLPAI